MRVGGSIDGAGPVVSKFKFSGQFWGRNPRVCRATFPIIPFSLWGRSGEMMKRM
jgi:hypothetical protein